MKKLLVIAALLTAANWAEDKSGVTLTLEFDKDLAGKEVAIIACLADGPRELKLKATKKPLTISVN